VNILIVVVTELNPDIGYEKAAKIPLAASTVAEIARQMIKIGLRSIHPKDTARGVQW